VYSARYAGEPKSDANNNAKLIADLATHADKSAYYYCVLVVRHADDPQPVIADGRWNGEIIASRAARAASATIRTSYSGLGKTRRTDGGREERRVAPRPGLARPGREAEMIPIKSSRPPSRPARRPAPAQARWPS
jgi:hypothetical protein